MSDYSYEQVIDKMKELSERKNEQYLKNKQAREQEFQDLVNHVNPKKKEQIKKIIFKFPRL